MQLGLRTKLTLVMTGLVFLVVVVLSAVFVSRLTNQVIHETNTRANELAQQIFEQAKHALQTSEGLLRRFNPRWDRIRGSMIFPLWIMTGRYWFQAIRK